MPVIQGRCVDLLVIRLPRIKTSFNLVFFTAGMNFFGNTRKGLMTMPAQCVHGPTTTLSPQIKLAKKVVPVLDRAAGIDDLHDSHSVSHGQCMVIVSFVHSGTAAKHNRFPRERRVCPAMVLACSSLKARRPGKGVPLSHLCQSVTLWQRRMSLKIVLPFQVELYWGVPVARASVPC